MNKLLARYPHKFDKQDNSSRAERRLHRKATAEALAQTSGLLLEIGGPTPSGFVSLGRNRLPLGLIVSNIEPTEGASQTVDARHIPYPPHSLGGIAMSALTIMPEEIAKRKRPDLELTTGYDPELMTNLFNMIELLSCEEDGDYSNWNNPEIMSYSQRLAMLREARIKIQPGGVLIVKMLLGGEIRLAEQLGFELKSTTVKEISLNADETNDGEFVFVLNDLETPAGLAIESSTSYKA